MGTLIEDLIPMFNREINGPGFERITASASQKLGYIEDGFFEIQLAGMLLAFDVFDGVDLVPPGTTGKNYFSDKSTKADDLEKKFWMMVVIFAGFRLLRLKIMDLAVNFTAEAGPVSFEQQASATVLRALLANLQGHIQELKGQYSDEFGADVFILMDGLAQSEYATLQSLPEAQIVY
jgi:hypothetical protein